MHAEVNQASSPRALRFPGIFFSVAATPTSLVCVPIAAWARKKQAASPAVAATWAIAARMGEVGWEVGEVGEEVEESGTVGIVRRAGKYH